MNNQLQSLLDDSLIATSNVEHSVIFRRKDVKLRANSTNFTLSNQEMEELANLFLNCSDTRSNGINLKGTCYKTIRADRFSIYGKRNNEGVVLIRSSTLIILATYSSEMYASICVEAAEKLGDYLREKGK